ncbi:MAG: hypothetical protein ACJA0X_001336 [Cyclobacteriaceae bacterium]|jgi:hypothetical protein
MISLTIISKIKLAQAAPIGDGIKALLIVAGLSEV